MHALADVLSDMHARDIALQQVMTALTKDADNTLEMLQEIQHIDLLAQIHKDLSNLLPIVAQSLTNNVAADFAACLTLQTLKEQLLEPDKTKTTEMPASGDLALF